MAKDGLGPSGSSALAPARPGTISGHLQTLRVFADERGRAGQQAVVADAAHPRGSWVRPRLI
eukprot:2624482-Alexandrium_andersonii.AAC.1